MSENVTPPDIAAAADFADLHEGFKTQEEVYQLAKAFALYRARERQAIVDWLLSMKRDDTNWPQHLAKRIERGEHLEAQP